MYYIQLGLVLLACAYAMPLIVTLKQDAMTDDQPYPID